MRAGCYSRKGQFGRAGMVGPSQTLQIVSGTDEDGAAYLAAVATAGGVLNDTEQTAVTAFVAGVKSDGDWPSLSWLYVPLGTFAGAGIAIKGANATLSGITASEYGRTGAAGGFACANNRYFDAPIEPPFNAGGAGLYLTGAYTFVTSASCFGAQNAGASQIYTAQLATVSTTSFRWGATGQISEASSPGLTPGLYSSERTAVDALRAMRNGVQIGATRTATDAPSSPGVNMMFMGRNAGGVRSQYLPTGLYAQAAYLSNGLSVAATLRFYNRLVTLLGVVGRS